MKKDHKYMQLQFKLIIIITVTIISLSIAEGGFRIDDYLKTKKYGKTMMRPSKFPGLVYELIPGRYNKNGVIYSINSHGFRWREITDKKKDSTYRIIFTGDSITMGVDVNIEETFPYKFDQITSQKSSLGSQTEIINAGVFGYEIKMELFQLKNIITDLKPDLIILGICANDTVFMTKYPGGGFLNVKYDVRYLPTLYNNSLLWRNFYDLLVYSKNLIKEKADRKSTSIIRGNNLNKYKIYFQEYIDICKRYHIKLIPLIFPTLGQVKEKLTQSQPYISTYAKEKGLPVIDLIEFFNKYSYTDAKELFKDAVHLTLEGHTAAAQIIYRTIQSITLG